MNKNKIINIFAFLVGFYLIIRAFIFYKNYETVLALIYFSLGVLAIITQIIVNYFKRKRKK